MPKPSTFSPEIGRAQPLPPIEELPEWIAGELHIDSGTELPPSILRNIQLAASIFHAATNALPEPHREKAFAAVMYGSAVVLVIDHLTEQGDIQTPQDPLVSRYASLLASAVGLHRSPSIQKEIRHITSAMVLENTFRDKPPRFEQHQMIASASHGLQLQALLVAHVTGEFNRLNYSRNKNIQLIVNRLTTASRGLADILTFEKDLVEQTPNLLIAFNEGQPVTNEDTYQFIMSQIAPVVLDVWLLLSKKPHLNNSSVVTFMKSTHTDFYNLFIQMNPQFSSIDNPLNTLYYAEI